MSSKARTNKRRGGKASRLPWVVGLSMVVLAFTLWSAGLLNKLEYLTLDGRAAMFGWFSPGPSDRIAVIAIDQGSLDAIGKWPWPRRDLAAIVRELRHARARVIALDLLLDDPEPPERVLLDPLAEIEQEGDEITGKFVYRHGDEALAAALRGREGDPTRVVLAAGFKFAEDHHAGERPLTLIDRAYAEFERAGKKADEAAVLRTLRASLLSHIPMDIAQSPEIDRLRKQIGAAKAIIDQAAASSMPLNKADALGERLLTPVSVEPQTPTPLLARSAARLGNVTFDTYDLDSKTRRIPIAVEHHGRLWPNLGLAAAMSHLGADPSSATIGHDALRFKSGDTDISVAVGRATVQSGRFDGMYYVTWPRALAGKDDADLPDWQWMFYDKQARRAAEIPIAAVFRPEQIDRRIKRQLLEIHESMAKRYNAPRASPGFGDPKTRSLIPAERYREYVDSLRLALSISVGSDDFPDELATVRSVVGEARAAAAAELKAIADEHGKAKDPAMQTRADALRQSDGAVARRLEQIDIGLSEFRQKRDEMRKLLEGKLCIVGWVATGSLADFVATSIDARTPGPHLHAAVANSVLTGFQKRVAGTTIDLLSLALAGLIGTIIGVRSSVLAGPILAVCMIGVWYIIAGVVLWDANSVIVSFTGPASAIFFSVAGIFVYRLLVEQLARRRTEARFKSRVAPQVVQFLVDNPELDTMKPQRRELSVMFTDLAGFTTIAERLGSQTTAEVLAKYLGTMTDIVLARNATFDKYIGDAIVVFWGAPVDDPRHAAHACRAVLEMTRKLDEMNASGEFAAVGASGLGMRIGLSAGEVMVGDFGAPPKNSSYTTLGDTTNLASRLESANKAFGSRILVSARLRELAEQQSADDPLGPLPLVWRPLGRVRVKGKAEPIEVMELVGDLKPKGDLTPQWIDATGAIVSAYQRGDFDACDAAINDYARRFGDDSLLSLYRDQMIEWSSRVDRAQAFDGCVELKEK